MKIFVPEKLKKLAENLEKPLYIVGGYVRNAIAFNYLSCDIDICADMSFDELLKVATKLGFRKTAFYKTTGTGVISDGKHQYEFAMFRREEYSDSGEHTPIITEATSDIKVDALRRDFKCNAVYYDIKNDEIVDPLSGLADIENRVLDTVRDAKAVFSRDGLRLLRLARFASETGFTPTKEALMGMAENADNIKDISKERIYEELKKILSADKRYIFSPKDGHYRGLKILDSTRVLDRIIPELTAGRGMAQRSDYHKYDVLEHSLKTALYSDSEIRIPALLHDIGKPYALKKDGKYSRHAEYGATISRRVLNRLKADKKTISLTAILTREHYFDTDCTTAVKKVRRFIVKNYDHIELLLKLKTADHFAHKDETSECPTVSKWKKIIEEMQSDGTPITLKGLHITAKELKEIGYEGKEIGEELKKLHSLCVDSPKNNDKLYLFKKATLDFKKIKKE